jgi:uncharacterized membrane protein SpoIIM required for sporulation
MAYFQTQNPDLGKFWRVLQWKILVYYMSIWSILWLFSIHTFGIWYILCLFGMFNGYIFGIFVQFFGLLYPKNLATLGSTYFPVPK